MLLVAKCLRIVNVNLRVVPALPAARELKVVHVSAGSFSSNFLLPDNQPVEEEARMHVEK